MITSWTPTPKQKFVTIRPGVSFPRMRDFARQITHQKVFFFGGGGVVQLTTAKAPGRILMQNTPKLAVLRKDVSFRGREHKIKYLDPHFPELVPFLGPFLTRLKIFA